MGAHFGVGEFTHFRTSFTGDWDFHWGYDMDFPPILEPIRDNRGF